MVLDPDFGDINEVKATSGRRPRRVGRWVVYSLLAFSGCHMLGTGSPIPLWHIERLDHPARVSAVGDDALELHDGRKVRLPFIKRLPKNDPCFAKALAHGVEVSESGDVYGLIDPARMCGNDPTVFYRVRVNLSELAGVLDPDGIDLSVIHPEAIRDFKENHYTASRDRRGMPFGVSSLMGYMRRIYQAPECRTQQPPVVTRTFSVQFEDAP